MLMPISTDDLEENARKAQNVVDRWDDGIQDIHDIARDVGLLAHEVRDALIGAGRMTFAGDDPPGRISEVRAADVGTTFIFDVEVMSVRRNLSLPRAVSGTCVRCESASSISLSLEDLIFMSPMARNNDITLQLVNAHMADGGCERSKSATRFSLTEDEAVDWTILMVSDTPDEKNPVTTFEDVRLPLHLLFAPPPIAGRIRVRATVKAHPSKRETCLIAYEYQPLEELPKDMEPDETTTKWFSQIARDDLATIRNQVAPDMIGRPLVQESRVLVLHSLNKIPKLDGEAPPDRGTLHELLFGDTTTNKSESALDTVKQGFGPRVDAENASRTGLTYHIEESKATGEWNLEWGTLVRNHGKWVLLDGTEAFQYEEQRQLRAVLREQEVRVDRMRHGRRPCAVRLTMTTNPDKPMAEYPFPCAAIPDIPTFRHRKGGASTPDIARIDIWLPFDREDVAQLDIADRTAAKRPYPDDVWLKKILWVRTRRPEDVSYTEPAKEAIRKAAGELMTEYGCASLPIAHSGLRETVSRIAVAFAALRYSTPDGVKLIVTDAHVAEADAFLRRMYGVLQLKEYKDHIGAGVTIGFSEYNEIIEAIGKDGVRIIEELVRKGPKPARELADILGGSDEGWSTQIVQDKYNALKDRELINPKPGKGAVPTTKAIKFYKSHLAVNTLLCPKPGTSRSVVPKSGHNNELGEGPVPADSDEGASP